MLQVPSYFSPLIASLFGNLKKSRLHLIQKYIQELFAQAEEKCYSEMLKAMYDVIISNQVQAPDIVDFFVRLRRKTCKLVKLQSASETPSQKVFIKVINMSVVERLKVI